VNWLKFASIMEGRALEAVGTYSDYRDLLREELATRCQVNARYSLRAFARDLAIAPSRLSEILNGKQGLSRPAAAKMAIKLGYSESETELFCDLVASQHSRSKSDREVAQIRLKKHQNDAQTLRIKADTFQLISEWYHLAILELTNLSSFNSAPEWIARALGISEPEVVQALARLERLGFIEQKNGTILPVENRTSTPGGIDSESIKKFHRQILQKAINAIVMQPLDQRELSAFIISISLKQLPAAKEKIRGFWREFCTEMDKSREKDSVYCLSMQFFNLMEGHTNENLPH
jgi:uncharacterized protein (TIGR02147 family)